MVETEDHVEEFKKAHGNLATGQQIREYRFERMFGSGDLHSWSFGCNTRTCIRVWLGEIIKGWRCSTQHQLITSFWYWTGRSTDEYTAQWRCGVIGRGSNPMFGIKLYLCFSSGGCESLPHGSHSYTNASLKHESNQFTIQVCQMGTLIDCFKMHTASIKIVHNCISHMNE